MRKTIISLVLLISSPIFTFAQLDSVYTLSGEVYVGKVEQFDNYITIISKSNARIMLEKKYIQNIVLGTQINFEDRNEFRNPDGDKISIHFTPFFSSGKLSIKDGNISRSYDFENTTDIEVSIKIPFNNLTFEPFYRSNTSEIKISDENYSEKFDDNVWGCKVSYYIK